MCVLVKKKEEHSATWFSSWIEAVTMWGVSTQTDLKAEKETKRERGRFKQRSGKEGEKERRKGRKGREGKE